MQPIGTLTFRDYIIAVAEELGCADYGAAGDEAAQVPSDPDHLALCRKLVNRGLADFYADERWDFLYPVLDITLRTTAVPGVNVEQDTGRYFMPAGFAGLAFGRWAYGAGSNVGLRIEDVSDSVIRDLYADGSSATGYPTLCAFRPLPRSDGPAVGRPAYEAVFWPRPSASIVVSRRIRIEPHDLVELNHVPLGNAAFQSCMMTACLRRADHHKNKTGAHDGPYERHLAAARDLNRMMQPATLGINNDPSIAAAPISRAAWRSSGGVSMYGATPIDAAS